MDAKKQYNLSYLPLFWDDMAAAVLNITETLKNPDAADRLIDQVESEILKHLENPEAATVYKTTRERELPYYWFRADNYMVFYVVFGDTMEVRRMIYGARDLTKMV